MSISNKINSVSSLTSISINPTGILPSSGTIVKIIVNKLYDVEIPSPNYGAFYQAICIITSTDISSVAKEGYKKGRFVVIAGNPSNSSSGGMNANELWVAKMPSSFWNTYNTSDSLSEYELTELTQIQSGFKIEFKAIDSTIAGIMDNSLTPETFNNPCVSGTVYDHRINGNYAGSINAICNILENLNLYQFSISNSKLSINNGLCLSYTSPNTIIDIASGNLSYGTGIKSHTGGAFTIPSTKGLYGAIADADGTTTNVVKEDSLLNPVAPVSLVSTLNGTVLPNMNGWSHNGAGVVSLFDNNIRLTTANNTSYVSLAGITTAGLGNTIDFMVHSISNTNTQPLKLIIDTGASGYVEQVEITNAYIKLLSNNTIYYFNNSITNIPNIPFVFRLTLKANIGGGSATSKLYFSGQSTPLLTNNNILNTTGGTSILTSSGVAFGFIANGNNTADISLVNIYNNGAIIPRFSFSNGGLAGTFAVSSSTSTPRIGITGCLFDENLGNRISGSPVYQSQLNNAINNGVGRLPAYYHNINIVYVNANTVQIKAGSRCRDILDSEDIIFNNNLNIDISINGAGGLDTGVEAINSWYYLYAIKNSNTGQVSAILSTINESITSNIVLPTGFDKKRQLKIAIRNNNSSNILPFVYLNNADILYHQAETTLSWAVMQNGGATSWSPINCGAFVPPISRLASFNVSAMGGGGGNNQLFVRETGSGLSIGRIVISTSFANGNWNGPDTNTFSQYLNSLQQFDYQWTTGISDAIITINNYTITEVS